MSYRGLDTEVFKWCMVLRNVTTGGKRHRSVSVKTLACFHNRRVLGLEHKIEEDSIGTPSRNLVSSSPTIKCARSTIC